MCDDVPHDEVERMLARQRQLYEEKIRAMQQKTEQRTSRPSQSSGAHPRGSTPVPPTPKSLSKPIQKFSVPVLRGLSQRHNLFPPTHNFSDPFFLPPTIRKNGPSHSEEIIASISNPLYTSTQSVVKRTIPRRDRSASRSRPKPKTTQDEALNCRTCKNRYGLYIYQCNNGHSSCRDCKNKGAKCGICENDVTDMRNIALETFIARGGLNVESALGKHIIGAPLTHIFNNVERTNEESSYCIMDVPCPNESEGCRLHFKIIDMDAHLKECPFNEIACPVTAIFGSCSWRGKIYDIMSHFYSNHPEHLKGAVNTELLIPHATTNSITMHLIKIGPYIFLVHVKVDESVQAIFMTVQLFGTTKSAGKWTYEIHIYHNPRRYEYSDVCHSNCVAVEDIFKKSKCLVLPFCFATNYADEGGLKYMVSLKKGPKDYESRYI